MIQQKRDTEHWYPILWEGGRGKGGGSRREMETKLNKWIPESFRLFSDTRQWFMLPGRDAIPAHEFKHEFHEEKRIVCYQLANAIVIINIKNVGFNSVGTAGLIPVENNSMYGCTCKSNPIIYQ